MAAVLKPMLVRDPQEAHRVASPLELFFDLVFVIAISTAGASAHSAILAHHSLAPLLTYIIVFEFVWWAWTNFSWFASSFDTDDWLYRLLTFVQMFGVLVLAAGIEPLFATFDARLAASGYVIMRVAMVGQWSRASLSPHWQRKAHASRTARTARTVNTAQTTRKPRTTRPTPLSSGTQRKAHESAAIYAVGISMLQILWLLWAFLLKPGLASYLILAALIVGEWTVPLVAEHHASTQWHPHHITERHGLFTIILLGESLLSSSSALFEALHEGEHIGGLIAVSIATFVVSAAIWWVYFWPTHHEAVRTQTQGFLYSYLHLLIFAAIGAFGVATELMIDAVHAGTLTAGHTADHASHALTTFPTLPTAALLATLAVAGALLGIGLVYLLTRRSRSANHPQG